MSENNFMTPQHFLLSLVVNNHHGKVKVLLRPLEVRPAKYFGTAALPLCARVSVHEFLTALPQLTLA
jgi:hypothetical protein